MGQTYKKEKTAYIAYPLGGFGTGMICIQGNGGFGQFSLRNRPDLNNEPYLFAAVCLKQEGKNRAMVLESAVPDYKIFARSINPGLGLGDHPYGLPRFAKSEFSAEFPFAKVRLTDYTMPIEAEIEAFNPFTPGDADNSSLPVASITYKLKNVSLNKLEGVFSFHTFNFIRIRKYDMDDFKRTDINTFHRKNGFVFHQDGSENDPAAFGEAYVSVNDSDAKINTNWFRGGWFDAQTMVWNDVENGLAKEEHDRNDRSLGGSISVPFSLNPGEVKTVTVNIAWYVPYTDLNYLPQDQREEKPTYVPWYAGRFNSVIDVMDYFNSNYDELYRRTRLFTDTFHDTDLPEEVISAIGSNLTILKSPTILRQTDGRMWAWEGCADEWGSCTGSCTHVWNYAQAICHLFPELERSLRYTELKDSTTETGHQEFRAFLPIQKAYKTYHAASDGQLGGIMKMYREWRIKGDIDWLRNYWDEMVLSIEHCIAIWDKKEEGVLKEPHHNTYDIEFWGADGMCSSFYIGALKAISLMGEALGKDVERYKALYEKGRNYIETHLFNGEYFYQETEWKTLDATWDLSGETESARLLMSEEGPKYQYGTGCLSDGVVGAWLAKMCGLGDILDPEKVKSHLRSVYRYNFKRSLTGHVNPQRSGYALGDEGGLLLCTWPRGGKPSLPFVYSEEVWTGIEYQVASHMLSFGMTEEALDIVRTLRARYDGTRRNPFDEYECGHWYARALASYGMIESITGIRYDAFEKTLYVGTDCRFSKSFLATDTGYGTVIVNGDKVDVNVAWGEIEINRIAFL